LNIVFIVGSYYPYYSAVGNCVGNIADEFAKEHQVTVICIKNFSWQKEIELIGEQTILRLATKDISIRNKLNAKILHEKSFRKYFFKLLLAIYRMQKIAKIVLSPVTINKELVNEYHKVLQGIDIPIDLIIPACLPFEGIIAASEYIGKKGRKAKMIPYLFDQFADNSNLHRFDFNKRIKRNPHLKLEKRVFSKSYRILALHSLRQHFEQDFPEINNIDFVEHPLLKKHKKLTNNNHPVINIVYAGSFYKKIRNPKYFLEITDKAIYKIKGIVNIYSFGNCSNIVKYYSKKNPLIINHGKVSSEKVYEALGNGDILIAVGNNDCNQVPSKIFEYMSFGKPIVYFYTTDNDVNLKILKKYPLALCLQQDIKKLGENITLFEDFCSKYSKSSVPFETVKRLYYDATPEYTADLITNIIKGENDIK